jgi:hypothetical protein
MYIKLWENSRASDFSGKQIFPQHRACHLLSNLMVYKALQKHYRYLIESAYFESVI